MRFDELQTGTRLELEILNNLDEKTGGPYVSQLLEPVTEDGMIISTPIHESRLVFISLNEKLRLTFFHRKYGFMGFTAVAEARETRGNISIVKVRALSEIVKIQRRKHYRLDCLMNCEYKILSSLPGITGSSSLNKATVKNLSGSGACIMSDVNVPARAILELFIQLDQSTRICALCIVIRSQAVEVKKSSSYELGLHFTEISQKDQDHIIRYIFEQQRLLLKKDVLDK